MKERPTKKGKMGIITRVTSQVMTRSSSAKILPSISDLVQAMATPRNSAVTRALMTLNRGGISRRKTISGSLRRFSGSVAMERYGMIR